jgi:maleylacetate reductase
MNKLQNSGWSKSFHQQMVASGVPVEEALPEAAERLSASRLVVVTTNSLAGPGGLAETVSKVLGSKFHSVVAGIHPHTPRHDVVRVVKALEGADGVVTIGGGSVCDSVKAARLCLANGITDAAGMDRLRPDNVPAGQERDHAISPSFPLIAIPTTLSAAEFTSGAGVTDERGPAKQQFIYPGMAPNVVILDPQMTTRTPPRLWCSTGIRAVDHAVELWCSISPAPVSDACTLYAAQLLIVSLQKTLDFPNDLAARLDCQKGAWLSVLGGALGAKAGASHGFGHALGGTAGMPHGETSCVMLPHVLRYNAEVNAERQAVIASAVGQPDKSLADIVATLISNLGLPSRLRDAGVQESVLEAVASDALLHDRLLLETNPRPITSLTEAMQLLKQAW